MTIPFPATLKYCVLTLLETRTLRALFSTLLDLHIEVAF